MRPFFRITRVLCLLLGAGAAPTALAQEVVVEAPQFAIGDTTDLNDLANMDGIDRSAVISTTQDGFDVQWVLANGDVWIDRYDSHINVVSSAFQKSNIFYEMVPSTLKYQFPLRIGVEWNGEYTTTTMLKTPDQAIPIDSYRTVISCRIECIEPVSVAAGTFDTLRISCDKQRSDQDYLSRSTYWFAPAAGVSARSETRRFDSGEITSAVELYAFQRASPVAFELSPEQRAANACEQVISSAE